MSQPAAERFSRLIDFSKVQPATPQPVRQRSDPIAADEMGAESPVVYQTLVDSDQCFHLPLGMQPILHKFVDTNRNLSIGPVESGVIARITILSALSDQSSLASESSLNFDSFEADINDGKLGLVTELDIYMQNGQSVVDESIVDTAMYNNPALETSFSQPGDRLAAHQLHFGLRDLEKRIVVIGNKGSGAETDEPTLEQRYVATFRPENESDLPFVSVTANPDNTLTMLAHKDITDFAGIMNKSRQPLSFIVVNEDELIYCGASKILGLEPGSSPRSTCAVVTTMHQLPLPKRREDSPRVIGLNKILVDKINNYVPAKALGTGSDVVANAAVNPYKQDGARTNPQPLAEGELVGVNDKQELGPRNSFKVDPTIDQTPKWFRRRTDRT